MHEELIHIFQFWSILDFNIAKLSDWNHTQEKCYLSWQTVSFFLLTIMTQDEKMQSLCVQITAVIIRWINMLCIIYVSIILTFTWRHIFRVVCLTLSLKRQFCSRRLWTYFVKKWKTSIIEWISYDKKWKTL